MLIATLMPRGGRGGSPLLQAGQGAADLSQASAESLSLFSGQSP